jgi:hypothetical protein
MFRSESSLACVCVCVCVCVHAVYGLGNTVEFSIWRIGVRRRQKSPAAIGRKRVSVCAWKDDELPFAVGLLEKKSSHDSNHS